MNAILVAQTVALEIRDMANDIDTYLASDVPMECYRKDIDLKINATKEKLVKMILGTTGLPVEVKNSVIPKCPVCHGERELNGMGGFVCFFCGSESRSH